MLLTRRNFNIVALSFWASTIVTTARSQGDGTVTVRIRVDETVRDVLQPIELSTLTVEPDKSEAAKELARRVPPGRAVPIILIIFGAIGVTELLKLIKELYRQTYYGGVLIDNRSQPPLVTSDPKIPANMVFVIDRDGKTSQFTSDQFSLEALKLALQLQ